ncbi:DUF7269 family protein [Halomicrobium salinisoli]|uniref:DUF7269 family protein n=1 Tax=Halomicrobium salinisoli TaxID=2878391 RepID=UPI001CF0436D|nr:hypothetical protein [Halomicrobium salinisoli]
MAGTATVESERADGESERERQTDPADDRAESAAKPPGDVGAGTARATLRTDGATDRESERARASTVAMAVGCLALAVALGALVVPARYLAILDAETTGALRVWILLLAAFVGLVGLGVTYARSESTVRVREEPVELATAAPETRYWERDERTAGTAIDDAIRRMGWRVDATSAWQSRTARETRDHLRNLTVRVLASETGLSEEVAVERVVDGSWTDDPRAAAFLGGASAPERPLPIKVRDWLHGAAFRRQVEATVDEISRLSEGESR